jgi:hypothetical protein
VLLFLLQVVKLLILERREFQLLQELDLSKMVLELFNILAAGGSTMAGFTINDGIVAAGGNNGMGTGTLTINGGTIVNNSATSRSPGNTSIVVRHNNFGFT